MLTSPVLGIELKVTQKLSEKPSCKRFETDVNNYLLNTTLGYTKTQESETDCFKQKSLTYLLIIDWYFTANKSYEVSSLSL
jgi:hypothetical protein